MMKNNLNLIGVLGNMLDSRVDTRRGLCMPQQKYIGSDGSIICVTSDGIDTGIAFIPPSKNSRSTIRLPLGWLTDNCTFELAEFMGEASKDNIIPANNINVEIVLPEKVSTSGNRMIVLEDGDDMSVSFSYILLFETPVNKALRDFVYEKIEEIKSKESNDHLMDNIIGELRKTLVFELIPCSETWKIMY